MSVRAVIDELRCDEALQTYVCDRISPEWRQQGDPLPAITVTNVATIFTDHLLGQIGHVESLIEVDIWSTSYEEVNEIAEQVKAVLNQFTGVSAGVQVERISLESYRDLGTIDGDKSIRRASMEFNVWYQEA